MSKAGVFASLLEANQIPKVLRGIESAVVHSFLADKTPGRIILVTGATDQGPKMEEVKRRGEICLRIFRELRGDLKWTVDRILDALPRFLRSELEGTPWEPEARRSTWSASTK